MRGGPQQQGFAGQACKNYASGGTSQRLIPEIRSSAINIEEKDSTLLTCSHPAPYSLAVGVSFGIELLMAIPASINVNPKPVRSRIQVFFQLICMDIVLQKTAFGKSVKQHFLIALL
jgi:hypothetical protein